MSIITVEVASVERDMLMNALKSMNGIKVYRVVESRPSISGDNLSYDRQMEEYPIRLEIHFNCDLRGLHDFEAYLGYVLQRPFEVEGREGLADFTGVYEGKRVRVRGRYSKGTILYGKVGIASLAYSIPPSGESSYFVKFEDGTEFATSFPASDLMRVHAFESIPVASPK